MVDERYPGCIPVVPHNLASSPHATFSWTEGPKILLLLCLRFPPYMKLLILVCRSKYKWCGNVNPLVWTDRRLFILLGGPIRHGELLQEFGWKGPAQTHCLVAILKLFFFNCRKLYLMAWIPFILWFTVNPEPKTRKLLRTHFHTFTLQSIIGATGAYMPCLRALLIVGKAGFCWHSLHKILYKTNLNNIKAFSYLYMYQTIEFFVNSKF